jgi:hypothetical protein
MAGSSSKRSISSKVGQLVAEVNSESQRSSKRRKQNSDEGSSAKEEEQIENKENSMIMINTSRQKVELKGSMNEGSKRGKRVLFNTLIVSHNTSGNVVVVHRKRKLQEISGGILNRSHAHPEHGMINSEEGGSASSNINPDQNKQLERRQSAMTVLEDGNT